MVDPFRNAELNGSEELGIRSEEFGILRISHLLHRFLSSSVWLHDICVKIRNPYSFHTIHNPFLRKYIMCFRELQESHVV